MHSSQAYAKSGSGPGSGPPPPPPPFDLPESANSTEHTPLLSGQGPVPSSAEGHEAAAAEDGQLHDDPGSRTAPPKLGPLRITSIALGLWLLIFLQASNMSGITMIQGAIAADLDAYDDTMWFTSGYLITMSSLAPLSGRLAAIFSPRSLVLPIAVSVALGSVLCACAGSFAVFVLGRVVTGVGGAGVMALAIILVLDLTDKTRRGLVMGMVNAGFTVGVSIGGVAYGALLNATGWRFLFGIQCPLALISGVALHFSIPAHHESPEKDQPSKSTWQKLRSIDYLGAALLVLTIVSFLYGLAGEINPLFLLISLATLIAFAAFEYFLAADPIIPLKVLSSRAVLLSCLAQLGLMSARWTVLFYTPIFMLAVAGSPRAEAGAVLVPTNAGFAIGGMLVGWFHISRNGSFWLPCLVSIAVFSLSMWALSAVASPTVSLAALILSIIACGLATGAALNYTLAHILHHSHTGTQYITTSLIGTFRGFGGAFGTSIGGGIFTRLLRSSLKDGFLALDGGEKGDGELSPARRRLVSQLLGAPELVYGGSLTLDERQVAVDAYAGASRGVWQAAALLGVAVLVLQAGTGWNGPPKEEEEEGGGDGDETDARASLLESEATAEA